MKKKTNILFIGLVLLIIIVVTIYFLNKKENLIETIKTTNDIDTYINTDDDDEDIDWSIYSEKEIKNNKITEEGIYTLSGNITDTITINTSGNVKLILNNVNIKSSNGPAIYVEEADNTLIYLADNTTNTLEDSSTYSLDDEDINGVIYSKDDLILDGTGSLTITANYQDGIVSKDDLKIINGNYTINSSDDGIRGKDSIYILDGTYNITTLGDGLKSTNDTDTEKGYILIKNGTFNIEAELDGIQAQTKLLIENGSFTIKTGGGSSNSSSQNDDWGFWGRNPNGYSQSSSDNESAKGLKSTDNLVIENGTFTFDTSDDAIHSNNYVGIQNGSISISSGDDGIHADTELIIDNGNIDISKSYEGLESAKMTINDGTINIVASDDGINIAGGNDQSSQNRPGQNTYSKNTNNILTINNGTIFVDAIGDGIDVNGSAYIYGGDITVEGPTDDGNGTLDYDNEFIVDGGSLFAVGSSGMLQSVSSTKQNNVTITLSSSYSANTKISILDADGNEIISYTPKKKFSSIIISSSKLVKNETYTIKLDNETYDTFTQNNTSTTIGNNYHNQMPNNMNPRR